MKVHIGDIALVTSSKNGAKLSVQVEDASKSDIIQGKVESVIDGNTNASAAFTYEIGQVYEFPRSDISGLL